jgi:hypothetical protein
LESKAVRRDPIMREERPHYDRGETPL